MIAFAAATLLCGCHNGDIEFGDYDIQRVSFAKQTPVRTIMLGTDVYPTTLDNEHRFEVYAVLSGVESNKSERTVQVAIDKSLCDDLYFADNGRKVRPLPADYYHLSGNTLTIPKGSVMGCVGVQLTDAFFADTLSRDINYVLPLRIVSADVDIMTNKDYTLYAVKYKNKWDGVWLSHGTDVINDNGVETTVRRDTNYVEYYDLRTLSTKSYMQVCYPITTTITSTTDRVTTTTTRTCSLILTFDDHDRCTITTDTPDCTASGSGQWTEGGAKKAWGGKDRDLLQLNYEISFNYTTNGAPAVKHYTSTDELIMRDRQSKKENFATTTK